MTTEIDADGIDLEEKDLSTVGVDSSDHGRIFYHNGNSTITLVSGATTSQTGHYSWDSNNSGWFPVGMGENPELQSITTAAGSSTDTAVEIGSGGAGFFVNGSGEVVVVDEAGNTTTIS